MAVTELLPSDFEAETAVRAWSARPLARARATVPHALEVAWPSAGRLRVTVAGLASVDQPRPPVVGACESFSLWRAGRQGRLDLDARFAVAVTSSLVGAGGTLAMARTLSPGERGMLAALVAAALDELAAPLQVGLEVPDAVPLRLDMQAELDLRFDTPEGRSILGWSRLLAPSAWVESTAARWEALAPLPFTAILELARTRIDVSSWSGARVGDALVFAGESAITESDSLEAYLSVGGMRAPISLRDGTFGMAGAFEPGPAWPEVHSFAIAQPGTAWKGTGAMSTTVEMPPPGAQSPPEPPSASLSQALSASPLEVVAELGRVVLTGAELAGLESGLVLSLGNSSRGTVTLTVAGRPVAKGVLVNIDGNFGVRITERF